MKEKYDIWIKEFMESWKQLDWKRTLETLDKNVKYYENPIDEPCNDDTIIIGSDADICNEYIFEGNLEENDLQSYEISVKDIK